MAQITITIANRIASAPNGVELVCNNPSDEIQFAFDSEWEAYQAKTARFAWQRYYIDVPFTGNTVNVPDIDKTNSVEIGVYADNIATTGVKIPFKHSIKSSGGTQAPPETNVYEELLNKINGGAIKGDPGYTPVRGTDYWTDADIASMQAYCEEMILEGKW